MPLLAFISDGGILYTLRSGQLQLNHYNARGDVVATSDGSGNQTWRGQYDGFGEIDWEIGTRRTRQLSNTKDQDVAGLVNEGFRYRDLETGSFLTRDPLGFVDGPNVYTYVLQNPWTKFDPVGLYSWNEFKEDVSVVADTARDWGRSVETRCERWLCQAGLCALGTDAGTVPDHRDCQLVVLFQRGHPGKHKNPNQQPDFLKRQNILLFWCSLRIC